MQRTEPNIINIEPKVFSLATISSIFVLPSIFETKKGAPIGGDYQEIIFHNNPIGTEFYG